MSTEQTRRIIERYFDLMGRAADFATCYTADATWLVADTGQTIDGPEAVRDYIVALHATLVDARTRKLVVGEDHAYLEGDCSDPASSVGGRIHYCVAYDIEADLITAMRCYGLGSRPTSPARC